MKAGITPGPHRFIVILVDNPHAPLKPRCRSGCYGDREKVERDLEGGSGIRPSPDTPLLHAPDFYGEASDIFNTISSSPQQKGIPNVEFAH